MFLLFTARQWCKQETRKLFWSLNGGWAGQTGHLNIEDLYHQCTKFIVQQNLSFQLLDDVRYSVNIQAWKLMQYQVWCQSSYLHSKMTVCPYKVQHDTLHWQLELPWELELRLCCVDIKHGQLDTAKLAYVDTGYTKKLAYIIVFCLVPCHQYKLLSLCLQSINWTPLICCSWTGSYHPLWLDISAILQ